MADNLLLMLKNLSIYRDILKDPVVSNIIALISGKYYKSNTEIEAYNDIFYSICQQGGSLSEHIKNLILYSENIFTLRCAKGEYSDIPDYIIKAVENDFIALARLSKITPTQLKKAVSKHEEIENLMPDFECHENPFFSQFSVELMGQYYYKNGCGKYSKHKFFSLNLVGEKPQLTPVINTDNIKLKNLKGFENQQNIIKNNTLAFVKGAKANNILIYGHRGTGKSSTVKAVVNEYCNNGLRLIEISKRNLKYLGQVIDEISLIPMKFIIFIDDLTFSENDENYNELKAILEGSTNKLSDNMVLYATTNRRHMITENFKAREGDEIHLNDTIDDTVSLSDRFGIMVTFVNPTKEMYLDIVTELALQDGVKIDREELVKAAIAWSSKRTSFSPRCARQFIDHVKAMDCIK